MLALSLALSLALALALALSAGALCDFALACPLLGFGSHGRETQTQAKESLMEKINVYEKARGVVRELVPVLRAVREQDRSLADQLKRAAQSVVLNVAEARGSDAGNAKARFSTACGSAKEVRAALNVASDWGYIEERMAARLDERLDELCAITWCLGRRL